MTSQSLGNVLISGGSGLVGQSLTSSLREKGYRVGWLSRSDRLSEDVRVFKWNVEDQSIDPEAVDWADVVVHLAGTGIADKRWTQTRKKIIMDSRVKSTELLASQIADSAEKPSAFISASAIGIYGADTGERHLTELSEKGNDFLASVVYEWESSIDKIEELGLRTVKNRLGLVLSVQGGALQPLMKTTKFWLGAPLGSGRQYMSWIHIDDVVNWFVKCIEDQSLSGTFNLVAENPVSNGDFAKVLANTMNKPLLSPNVPSFVMKTLLGEMAVIVLGGNYVVPERIQKTGHQFKFSNLEEALKDLIKG